MARVFISHSSRDTKPARQIKDWLQRQGFDQLFLDFDKHAGIKPGSDWEQKLYREIDRAEAVLLLVTPNWLASKWCFAEFTQARALGKAIFPIILTPDCAEKCIIAADIQHIDLTTEQAGGLAQLAAELREVALGARGGFEWDSSRPPFPGLMYFQEEDAAIFFGRDDDIRRVIERLNARRVQGGKRLLALLAASGAGKSSLMRAGVLPRLKKDPRNWITLPVFRPKTHPVDELAKALALAQQRDDWQTIRDMLMGDDYGEALKSAADDLQMAHKANEAQILIAIDQGEELFSTADPAQARRFSEILSHALAGELPFIALMGMRADFLGNLQKAVHLTARFEEISLKPLPLARIPQIIEGPARVAGIKVEDALVSAATNDASTEDALPLLAFALRELKEKFGKDNVLSLNDYQALGDEKAGLSPLENAVRKAADEVLANAAPTDEELAALRTAFIPKMVRVNEEGDYVRQAANRDELPAKAHPLLDQLADARLLVKGEKSIEVTHEALLRKWPLLRGWLDEAREFLIGKQQLERSLQDWRGAPDRQKNDALLSGLQLTRARQWLIDHPHQLEEEERQFIQKSDAYDKAVKQRQERLRKRLFRGAVAALVMISAFAVFAGVQWFRAQEQTRVAQAEKAKAEEQTGIAKTEKGKAEKALAQSQVRQSKFIASLATREIEKGDYGTALALALEAMPDYSAKKQRPYWQSAGVPFNQAIRNLRERQILKDHQDTVNSVAISPDGRRIISGSNDHTLRIWDMESGRLLQVLKGHYGGVRSVAISPDGRRIISGSYDKTMRIWDMASGKLLQVLKGHKHWVDSIAISPDGRRIISGSSDKTVRIWDMASGKLLQVLKGHQADVYSVAISPDSRRIISGSDDKTVRVWDMASGKLLRVLKGHQSRVSSVAISPDGRRIISGSYDNTVRIWDMESGRLLQVLKGHEFYVTSVAISPDGRRIISGSFDHTVRIWNMESGHLLGVLKGHKHWVDSVAISPDSRRIISGSNDKTVRIWDMGSGKQLHILKGHQNSINSVAISPDGRRIVSGSDDKTVRVWDMASGKLLHILKGHQGWVYSVAISSDGKRIISGSRDKTVRVWDMASGKLLHILKGHQGWVYSVDVSPDGRRIVSGSDDKTVRVWDAKSSKLLHILRDHYGGVRSVAVSPDGGRIVSGSDDWRVRVWDMASGKLLQELEGHKIDVRSVAISPDGRRIISGSDDKTMRIWDMASGKLLHILKGHQDSVYSVAISSDGRRIVSGSDDNTVWVWDMASGKLLQILEGHEFDVNSVAISPDGRRIISGSGDKTVRVWPVFPTARALVAHGLKNAPRCLTQNQREEFFLAPEPPTWCIKEEKYPYHTKAWKEWLVARRAGKNPPLPATK